MGNPESRGGGAGGQCQVGAGRWHLHSQWDARQRTQCVPPLAGGPLVQCLGLCHHKRRGRGSAGSTSAGRPVRIGPADMAKGNCVFGGGRGPVGVGEGGRGGEGGDGVAWWVIGVGSRGVVRVAQFSSARLSSTSYLWTPVWRLHSTYKEGRLSCGGLRWDAKGRGPEGAASTGNCGTCSRAAPACTLMKPCTSGSLASSSARKLSVTSSALRAPERRSAWMRSIADARASTGAPRRRAGASAGRRVAAALWRRPANGAAPRGCVEPLGRAMACMFAGLPTRVASLRPAIPVVVYLPFERCLAYNPYTVEERGERRDDA